jgi:hypothetical protein
MPTFQQPSMGMPAMPTLQAPAAMPVMGDATTRAAAEKARQTIANRKGRKSTFLTTTRPTSTRPTIMNPAGSRYGAKTSG